MIDQLLKINNVNIIGNLLFMYTYNASTDELLYIMYKICRNIVQ